MREGVRMQAPFYFFFFNFLGKGTWRSATPTADNMRPAY